MTESNKKHKSDIRLINVCFTHHMTAISDLNNWLKITQESGLPSGCTYLVAQGEKGSETDKYHIQGYAEFKNQMGLDLIQRRLNIPNAHCESRHGTSAQASLYCKKQDTRVCEPIELGNMKKQGERTDLAAIAESLKTKSLKEVALENPTAFIRYNKGMLAYSNLVNPPKLRANHMTYYIYGKSRCGKSAYARERWPDAYMCKDTPQGWFDQYMGEKTILIEEFRGRIEETDMLQLIDGGKLRMPVKGGFVTIETDTLVLLSNYDFDELYAGSKPWCNRIIDPDFCTYMACDDDYQDPDIMAAGIKACNGVVKDYDRMMKEFRIKYRRRKQFRNTYKTMPQDPRPFESPLVEPMEVIETPPILRLN